MGATPSVQREAKSPEDAPEDAVNADVNDTQDGENVDDKPLQKNGQISISSLNGKTEDQSEYNGHMEDNPLAEVGQTESISQKEDSPDTIEVHQEEAAPQVNGEKGDDSANADEITTTEEKTVEEKQEEANEVGFKKIFRFVGFKFTLKKDKSEKTEPVQLLTVKETEGGAQDAASEENKEEPTTEEAITEESKSVEEKSPETTEKEQETTAEDVTDEAEKTTDKPEVAAAIEAEKSSDEVPEKSADEAEVKSEKEPEPEVPTESTSPLSQETQSPFRRFFTPIFNLRKKTSFKKSKDEEQVKEKSVEEDIKETEEKAEAAVDDTEKVEVDAVKEPTEAEQIEKATKTEAETKDDTAEDPSVDTEQKDLKVEAETAAVAETVAQTETAEAPAAESADDAQPTEDLKPTNDKPDEEVITEVEILSSQEKAKPQGSPLKKLFTGAGLKKLSSKKQKSKKEAESKQAESGEQAAEHIQSSTESAEPQKPDSGASSPEESGEHVAGEVSQAEAAQAVEPDGELVTSDSEKKKDGILPWSSFKKLVTPKKRVKRPSESEDEATADKPKSATLSSTESASAVEDKTDDKPDEPKASEEVPSEPKEETQAESTVESKHEKAEPVAEEPKRKMDTSVSWEALICVGSSKKRARKTSDSDDEEPKIEEEVQQSGEEQAKTTESPLVSSGEADHENLASSPEPEEELVSTWESFKRLVTHRKKPKAEDKSDEASGPEQTTSDSEIPKEESSFSLKKLIPRRKKKSGGKQKQASSDVGSAEDDSDTPAVVPLSEYEKDASAEVVEKAEEVNQETVSATQVKATHEDRSPSWISTTVENLEDDADGKPLSDIPEEGDTAATPKSADNTTAEDIIELTSEAVTALEQVEETEMVSAISRVTASPVTSGETTPVPSDSVEKKTEVVFQEAVEMISVTTSAMTVITTEEQEKNVVITDALPIKSATKEEKTVLVAHEKTEATAICTGLDTKEVQVVKEEIISKTSVESITVVSQAIVTEISVEDRTEKIEKATVAEEEVCEAQVIEVKADLKDAPLENAVEEKVQFEEVKETPEAETVTDLQEAAAVKLAVMNVVQQEPEVLEEPVVAEEPSKVEAEGPVEPTVEESICAKTAKVTEVAIAKDENTKVLEDVKEAFASVEVAPVEELSVAVTEEVMATLPDVPAAETAESKEDPIPVVCPTEEIAVTKETVCVISSTSETAETHTAVLGHEATMEKVPLVVPIGDHHIQVIVNDVDAVRAQEVVESITEVASTKVTVVVEEPCKAVLEEPKAIQANQVMEAEIIEKQSSVIVQEIIQNVVENFVEAHEDEMSVEKVESQEVKLEETPAAVTEKQPSTDVSEEKTVLETTPEKSNTSEITSKDDDEQTRIIIEKPTKPINEAVEVAETLLVSLAGEISVQKEEVAAVSVTDVQQETEVTKSEVELKQAEEKTAAEQLSQTTESEDGKGQVEATETPASEEKCLSTETPAKVDIMAEQCQVAKEVQIQSAQEFDVGVVNVINAVDEHVQDTNVTEDSTVEDRLHKDSEELQTQDTKKQESEDQSCQKSDAKNVAAKQEIAAEKTTNAIAEEEVENDIQPVSTEVATVS